MGIDRVISHLKSCSNVLMTASAVIMYGLTIACVVSLPDRSEVSFDFGAMLLLAIAASSFAGIHLRSEWSGVMTGSACALALRWLITVHSIQLYATPMTGDRHVFLYCLVPAIAGFWGAFFALLSHGGESRRLRIMGAVAIVLLIGVNIFQCLLHFYRR